MLYRMLLLVKFDCQNLFYVLDHFKQESFPSPEVCLLNWNKGVNKFASMAYLMNMLLKKWITEFLKLFRFLLGYIKIKKILRDVSRKSIQKLLKHILVLFEKIGRNNSSRQFHILFCPCSHTTLIRCGKKIKICNR